MVTQDIGAAVFEQLPNDMQRAVRLKLYKHLSRDRRRREARRARRRGDTTFVPSSSSDDDDIVGDDDLVQQQGGWDDENDAEKIIEGKQRRPKRSPVLALTVPGLQPGRFYSFRIIAYNSAGPSEPGPSVTLGGLGTCCAWQGRGRAGAVSGCVGSISGGHVSVRA